MNELQALYQQMIIDHGRTPRNFGVLSSCSHHQKGVNPLCGDALEVTLLINEQDVVEDIKFTGEGCAISMASASMMTELVKGKTVQDAIDLFDDFQALVVSQDADDAVKDRLGKTAILEGVKHFPSRIKCATLSWHTLKNACQNQGEATTE